MRQKVYLGQLHSEEPLGHSRTNRPYISARHDIYAKNVVMHPFGYTGQDLQRSPPSGHEASGGGLCDRKRLYIDRGKYGSQSGRAKEAGPKPNPNRGKRLSAGSLHDVNVIR